MKEIKKSQIEVKEHINKPYMRPTTTLLNQESISKMTNDKQKILSEILSQKNI